MTQKIAEIYNAKEFFGFAAGENERYELIDGEIYMMASPSVDHQDISGYIYRKLSDYFAGKKCRPFIAPLDVVLFERTDKDRRKKDNSQNVFQPDVFAVCDSRKIGQNRINGAPDFVVEVVSPSNSDSDYIDKLKAYMQYGVKEYWIVDPEKKMVFVYARKRKGVGSPDVYTFEDKIKARIFEDLEIDFKELRL